MKFFVALLMLGAVSYIVSSNALNQKLEKGLQVNQLKETINELQDKSEMPGLQILVTDDDNTIFEYTRGIRAEGQSVKITASDEWHIGSCTKPMTAFLIGRLIDQGKLDWATTLAEIAPRDYKLDPSVRNITVEQLLSHRSGLIDVLQPESGHLWDSLFTDKIKPSVMREKLVRGLLASPVTFNPGDKVEYSNSGYVVLGWILEQVKLNSWGNIIKNELFEPLSMKSCGFGPAGSESQTTAVQPWSHTIEGEKLVAVSPSLKADNPPALGPAGTVHCNVNDWHKFLKLFIRNEGVRSGLLSQVAYDKLLSNAGEGPFTFISFGRVERPWAQGTVFTVAGSNTMNYAIVAIAPNINRIFTINTNAGHAKAEASVIKILKYLTNLE